MTNVSQTVHELKTWPVPFERILDGHKTHEYRKDDRGFTKGNLLRLREWDPIKKRYTGRALDTVVTDLCRGPDWRIPEGYVVMSVQRRPPAIIKRINALERVANATQALEDAWLQFFKLTNSETLKGILQVEEEICNSLAALRVITGDLVVRDWEAVDPSTEKSDD